MIKKKTTEQFKKEVYERVGDEYEVLSEYNGNKVKIEIKHNKCGCRYMVRPNDFLTGYRCPECFGNHLKTTEQFKKEVYERVGDEYEVLGEYSGAKVKIDIKHNKCGHLYTVTPNAFLNGNRCPECFGNHLKTTEQFKKEVYDLVGDEYEVLGKYTGNKNKIEIKHNKCGHAYMVRPSDFILKDARCPECFGTHLKTAEQFKKEVYDLVGDEYEVLGKYTGNKNKIEIKHNKCGHAYMVIPSNFLLQDSRCPECFGTHLKTTEEFKKEVYDLVEDEYEVLDEYVNSYTPINMKHNKCEYVYPVRPSSFLRGSRCPECFGTHLKTTEQFKKEVYEKVGDEFEVLGKYINNKTPLEIKHSECGCTYLIRPNDFLRRYRCPKCSSRKGESAIIKILEKYNITYLHNKPYGGCKYKSLLRFDFLIFDNNNLKLICEFDGEQHFKPVEIYKGEDGFLETQVRDEIKNRYCSDNQIPLLRIPYWEFDNIDVILCRELYKLGLI